MATSPGGRSSGRAQIKSVPAHLPTASLCNQLGRVEHCFGRPRLSLGSQAEEIVGCQPGPYSIESGAERKPVFSILSHDATVPVCLDMADHPDAACFQPERTTPAWAPTRLPGMTPLHGFGESQGPRLRRGKPFTCSDSGDCSTGTRQAIRLSGVHGTVRVQCVRDACPVHMVFERFSRGRAWRRHLPRPYRCETN